MTASPRLFPRGDGAVRRRLRVPRNRPRAMADDGITFDANYQIRILDADKFKATEALQGQAGEFVAKVSVCAPPHARRQRWGAAEG